jgi:serine/threonine-protein kinase
MLPASMSPGRGRPCVGAVLGGKWRIDALLGAGGMASVYRATHRNGHRVAVKVLHPELSCNDEVRRRFLLEGYAANAIEHPGVVRVLDDDVTGEGAAFLVMELLEGETLDARCERLAHRMAPAEVAAIAEAVLDLLAAAHEQWIIHRDVKPENVFLTSDGAVRVLDFGIAQVRGASTSTFATQAGATFGTPAFMSPEQALGRSHEVDGRSDVWAVGATMFWAVSGRAVHEGSTINETLVAAATRPAPPLASVAPHAGEELASIVDRALAMDRAARWQDAGSMRDALRALRLGAAPAGIGPSVAHVQATTEVSLPPTFVPAPPRVPKWRGKWATGITLCAVAISVFAWLAVRRPTSSARSEAAARGPVLETEPRAGPPPADPLASRSVSSAWEPAAPAASSGVSGLTPPVRPPPLGAPPAPSDRPQRPQPSPRPTTRSPSPPAPMTATSSWLEQR